MTGRTERVSTCLGLTVYLLRQKSITQINKWLENEASAVKEQNPKESSERECSIRAVIAETERKASSPWADCIQWVESLRKNLHLCDNLEARGLYECLDTESPRSEGRRLSQLLHCIL